MDFRFVNTYYLLLLIPLIVFTIALGWRLALSRGRRWTAMSLRVVVIALVLFSLAEIQHSEMSDRLTTIYVLDDSDSIPPDKKKQAEEFIKESVNYKPKKDRMGLVVFGHDASLEYAPREKFSSVELRSVVRRNQTNIANALQLALATFGEDTKKRIVLITDGNQTTDNAKLMAREAKSLGVAIDVLPIEYSHRNDIVVEKVISPGRVNFDEKFKLWVYIRSLIDTKAELSISLDGQPILQNHIIELKGGENVKNFEEFSVQIPELDDATSFHNFKVRVDPIDGEAVDYIPENNIANSFTWTSGKQRVLLVDGDAGDMNHLEDALVAEKIKVDRIEPSSFPQNYATLLSYDSIIFSNVHANAFTQSQMESVENAVHELGIGFIMVGGEDSFGAGGYQDTPIEEALPVHMEIKNKEVIPKGALVLILHTCEFANGNKWAKDIARAALDVLSSRDMMGVLYYDYRNGEDWLYEIQEVKNKVRMKKLISTCNPGDMPTFAPTMDLAYRGLVKSNASVKHLVIISDGDPQRPSKKTLNSIAAAKITMSTICINPHSGSDTSIMQDIAKVGRGRYYNPSNPMKLPQIFTKEASTIRKTLIVEHDFQPQLKEHSELLADGFSPGDFPMLQGYVATEKKKNADVPLVSHEADPIMASWRHGLGKTVAFTSDAKNRWAASWVNWAQFNKFWAQTVRWSMRSLETGKYQLTTSVQGGKGKVVIDSVREDVDDEFEAIAIAPDLSRRTITVRQTGPGRYEGEFDAEQVGTYLVRMQPRGTTQILTGGFSMSYSPEFIAWNSNEALLKGISEDSGGRYLEWTDDSKSLAISVFSKAGLSMAQQAEPFWPITMALALLLLPLDIFIRRVMVDWSMVREYASTAALATSGAFTSLFEKKDARDETVESLLDVKARVRSRHAHSEEFDDAPAAPPTTAVPKKPSSKKDRLEQLDDLKVDSNVMDTAKKDDSPKIDRKKKSAASAEPESSGESELSRLMAAKKRALKKKR